MDKKLLERYELPHICDICAHDGQCDGLPRCGGAHWEPGYVKCHKCGEWVYIDDAIEEADGFNYCEECDESLEYSSSVPY